MFAAIIRNPRGQKLLESEEGARGEHLCSQRIRLELLEIRSQIPRLCLSSRQPLSHSVRKIILRLSDGADGLLLELDGHGGQNNNDRVPYKGPG